MPLLRFRYQTIEFDKVDIHLRTLRDRQEFLDADNIAEDLGISSAQWPLFGIVWESSEILAQFMFDFDITGKRILEVGCGIGLTSLMLNKRLANITATDYHPEVEGFLLENIELNSGKVIPFFRTGWADEDCGLGKFDLILGSDLLYERGHAELLSAFIQQHANPECEVVLVDPGRGYHARFSKRMVNLGYAHSQSKPEKSNLESKPFSGQILRYSR
jgi:ETFB lysine methyltransferase